MKSLMTKYALSALTIALVSSPLALAKKDGHPNEDVEAKLVTTILSYGTESFSGINVPYECKNITSEKGKFGSGSSLVSQKYLFSNVANGTGLKMASDLGEPKSVEHFIYNDNGGYYSLTRPDMQDLKMYVKIYGGTIAMEMTVDKTKSFVIESQGQKNENGVEQKTVISVDMTDGKDYPKSTLGSDNELVVGYALCTQSPSEKTEKESK